MYNNTQNETTEETPFQANYEYNSKVWQELQAHKSQSQKAILNIAEIKKLHKDLTNRIQQQKRWTTKVKPFEVKERVYLRTDNIHVKRRSKKLNNKSIKLFKVKRNIKELSYKLDLLKKMWIHSVFHVFMLQCCNQSISLQTVKTSVELNEEYQVENILEKWMISGKTHYLIKWKEYNTSEKHVRTQREPTQLCKNITAVWERASRSIKKLELIDFSKELRLKESEKFSLFSVSLLSLLSSKATQWTLTIAQDSFCFRVLKRWRTFASSLKRCLACFTHSFIATLSSDFS